MSAATRVPWITTERQGPGRRYWFSDVSNAALFAHERRIDGRHVQHDEHGMTVWVSLGWQRTPAVDDVLNGKDPEESVRTSALRRVAR